ncbi:MAG: hypothetical protein K8L99_00380 [Anaerolineae bacterium]|nr:hypothetical protein [Anaerolineae bacterium]
MTNIPKIQSLAPDRINRWEYMTLSYNYSYGSTTYEINGEKEVRLKNVPLHEALSLLGQQGWELVSIAEGKLYVLKRPASTRTKTASTPEK